MALRVTPHKARGPSLIRGLNSAGKMVTIDREDGWGVEFKTNAPHPYTIFQSIVRKMERDEPGQRSPDRERFTEAWHSHAHTDILDKFVIARYYRVGLACEFSTDHTAAGTKRGVQGRRLRPAGAIGLVVRHDQKKDR